MVDWSEWQILIGTGGNLRQGAKDLPEARYIVYEIGLASDGTTPRPVYVGHGNRRRLAIHRGSGWEDPEATPKSSTELLPYAVPCILNGFTIYYRYAPMGSKMAAKRAELELSASWWNYPWNNEGVPWEGARRNWARWVKPKRR